MINKHPVISHTGGQDNNGYWRSAFCEMCKEEIAYWHIADNDPTMNEYWDAVAAHVQDVHLKVAFVTEK